MAALHAPPLPSDDNDSESTEDEDDINQAQQLLKAPTHSGTTRRPRRQDLVQRKRKLKEQHQQYQKQRQQQIKPDKQRAMQVGSLVQVVK
jgi:hypothetical protein